MGKVCVDQEKNLVIPTKSRPPGSKRYVDTPVTEKYHCSTNDELNPCGRVRRPYSADDLLVGWSTEFGQNQVLQRLPWQYQWDFSQLPVGQGALADRTWPGQPN